MIAPMMQRIWMYRCNNYCFTLLGVVLSLYSLTFSIITPPLRLHNRNHPNTPKQTTPWSTTIFSHHATLSISIFPHKRTSKDQLSEKKSLYFHWYNHTKSIYFFSSPVARAKRGGNEWVTWAISLVWRRLFWINTYCRWPERGAGREAW